MKIKRVCLVSEKYLKALEDEFKTIAKSIEYCIHAIQDDDIDVAIWTLERMKENINKTLEEDNNV